MKPSVRRHPVSFIIVRRLDHRNITTPVIYSLLPFQRLPPWTPRKPHLTLGKITIKTTQERRSGFTGLNNMAVVNTNLFIAIQIWSLHWFRCEWLKGGGSPCHIPPTLLCASWHKMKWRITWLLIPIYISFRWDCQARQEENRVLPYKNR